MGSRPKVVGWGYGVPSVLLEKVVDASVVVY